MSPGKVQPAVRPVGQSDRPHWEQLYAGYAAFYRVEQTPLMRARVWSWLMDPGHEVDGLVAEDGARRLIGLAHYRPFARPLAASTGGFLDDLFVLPEARGSGAGRALVQAVAEVGRRRDWSVIRWITAEDNAPARRLYDDVALQTGWVTYEIRL